MTEWNPPITVVAHHLHACAMELSSADVPLDQLGEVLENLVTGQEFLSVAIDRMARRLDTSEDAEMASLSEVLQAASSAFGHAADALAASEHLVEKIIDDTHF